MKSISEKRGVRLTGMTLEEVIQLLQNNNFCEGLRQVSKFTIEVEQNPTLLERIVSAEMYDYINNGPRYSVEFDDSVDLFLNSKEDLKDICFNRNIIP